MRIISKAYPGNIRCKIYEKYSLNEMNNEISI